MRKCKLLSTFMIVFLLLSILLSLSSCHGMRSLPEFVIPIDFDPDEEIAITFWAKNENNEYQQQVYRDAVKSFGELYPSIHVSLKLYSNYTDIYKDVITNISTSTTPNVCITYPDHIATYMSGANVVVPLNSLIEDSTWGLGSKNLKFDAPTKNEMISQFMAEGVIDGEQYALPFMRSTEACYINVDLVRAVLGDDDYEIPEYITWDWIFEVSEAAMAMGKSTVTDDNGNSIEIYNANEQKVLIPLIYKSTDNMMIQMLKQKGAGYSTDDCDVLIFNDDTEEILIDIADHTRSGAFSTFKISSYPGNYLNAGQCIFAIDSTAGATWMGADAPNTEISSENILNFEMAVRAVPQYDTNDPQMISQGPSICIFNKEDPKEVMASWIFVQYLLTNAVQTAYAQTEGYVPVTKKTLESAEYQDYLKRAGENNTTYYKAKIEASRILLDNLDNTFITSVFNGSASLRDAAGQMIEEVVKGVRRGKNVNTSFISDLYDRMTVLYHLDEFSSNKSHKKEFGDLPSGAVALIAAVIAVWICLAVYFIVGLVKRIGERLQK